MIQRNLTRFFSTTALALALLPYSVLAQAETTIKNPLGVNSVADFIARALQAMVLLALPVVALFFVIAGFMFISARGNTHKLQEARENFVYVIIGGLLIIGAWVIATMIGGTVTQVLGS